MPDYSMQMGGYSDCFGGSQRTLWYSGEMVTVYVGVRKVLVFVTLSCAERNTDGLAPLTVPV